MRLTDQVLDNSLGPAAKDFEKVFYNSAMAGSRTRSVILMKHIIESGYLGNSEIYATSGDDSCTWANDGECDVPSLCDTDTDTTDCGGELNRVTFS